MLRWMTPILVAMCAAGTAAAQSPDATKAADGPAATKPADSPAAAQPTDKPATAKPSDNQTTAKPAESPATVKPANSPAAAKRAGPPATARRATIVAAGQLPPGLPRVHYKYRTTVAPAAPLYVRRGRALVIEEETEVFAPLAAYAPRINGTPLLPGSATLPGYYGTTHSYSYDGPYYGGPYTPYWDRLPYACGVYGYC